MSADIAELGNLDASEVHARRLKAKQIKTSKKVFFPNRRWNSKIV